MYRENELRTINYFTLYTHTYTHTHGHYNAKIYYVKKTTASNAIPFKDNIGIFLVFTPTNQSAVWRAFWQLYAISRAYPFRLNTFFGNRRKRSTLILMYFFLLFTLFLLSTATESKTVASRLAVPTTTERTYTSPRPVRRHIPSSPWPPPAAPRESRRGGRRET